jgi:hypothetical protein
MWGPLQHAGHVEFYEKLHRNRRLPDEDWIPMVRAVQHFQSLASAPHLYAFTSLWRFYLTTAPTFQECGRHSAVNINWHWQERQFRLALDALAKGWVDDWQPEESCDETSFPSTVEPFIRLLASQL